MFSDEQDMENPVVVLHSSDGYNFSPLGAASFTWPRQAPADANLLAVDVDGDQRLDLATWTEAGLYVARNSGR